MNFSVILNGSPVNELKYSFDEETKVFSSKEDYLVIDFGTYADVTFELSDCFSVTLVCGPLCTINVGERSHINCGEGCVINALYGARIYSGGRSKITADHDSNIDTRTGCYIRVGERSIVKSFGSKIVSANSCYIESPHSKIITGSSCIIYSINSDFHVYMSCYYNSIIKTSENSKFVYGDKLCICCEERSVNTNDNYIKELDGFVLSFNDLLSLKDYPLNEPRKLMLHVNDELGNRLFRWYKDNKLL